MSKGDSPERRYVPPGSCTWCGHKEHDVACGSSIRTGPKESEPCPCRRPEWAAGALDGAAPASYPEDGARDGQPPTESP